MDPGGSLSALREAPVQDVFPPTFERSTWQASALMRRNPASVQNTKPVSAFILLTVFQGCV